MPWYSYKAVDGAGKLVDGELESESRPALIDALRRQGLQPLHTTERSRSRAGAFRLELTRRRGDSVSADDLALFSREMATLLGAGLPLEQALLTLSQQADGASDATAKTSARLLKAVRSGSSFADALSERELGFPNHYTGLIRAGEAGGTLATVMANLAESEESSRELRQEIRSALNYPIIVLLAAGASILVLLLGVIPEFEPLFAGAGDALPFSAELVLGLSKFLRDWWFALPALALLLFVVLRAGSSNPDLKAGLDHRLLGLPLIGPLIHKIEAARFCRTMGTLLANGVDIVPALQMSANVIANSKLNRAVEATVPQLRRGEGLSEPLKPTGLLPPLALRLVQIGETSGQMGPMMLTVARIYEGEVSRDTKKMVSMLVPLVTLFLGVIVAGIIGSILSAILTSYDLPF